jgi:hypothetical protein
MELERVKTSTVFEAQRLTQFVRVCDGLATVDKALERSPLIALDWKDYDDEHHQFMIDHTFAFGVWLMRKGMYDDIAKMGMEDTAMSIMVRAEEKAIQGQ